MKKPIFLIIFLLGLIIALSMVKAVFYNRLSASGAFVGEVEDKINFYKTQNAILSEELLILSSLTSIADKALELGFIKEKDSLLVLKTSRSLAVKR